MGHDGGWLELESDPGLFSLLAQDLGVTGVQVEEVYDLSNTPEDAHGFIFLFCWKEDRRARRRANQFLEDQLIRDETRLRQMFFAHQVITNSCATHALLSVLLNCPNIRLGETLGKFKEDTCDMDAELKGLAIGNVPAIAAAHNRHSRPEPIRLVKETNGAASVSRAAEAYHFVSFVPIDGHLVELDGLKAYPIDHGPLPSDRSWTHAFRDMISQRIGCTRFGETDIRYNLLSVVDDRVEQCHRRLKELEQEREKLLASVEQTFRSIVASRATSTTSSPVASPVCALGMSSSYGNIDPLSSAVRGECAALQSAPIASTSAPLKRQRSRDEDGTSSKRPRQSDNVDGAVVSSIASCGKEASSMATGPPDSLPDVVEPVKDSGVADQPSSKVDCSAQQAVAMSDASDLSAQSLSASFVNSLAAPGLATLAALAPSPRAQDRKDAEQTPTETAVVEGENVEVVDEDEKVFLSGLDTLAAVAPSPPSAGVKPELPTESQKVLPLPSETSGEEDSLMSSCAALANSLSALKPEGEVVMQHDDDSQCSEVVRAAQVLVSVLRRCSGNMAEQLPSASAMLKGACQPLITDNNQDADVETIFDKLAKLEQELAACQETLCEEEAKQQSYKADHCRRTHNYGPFISTFLIMLAKQGLLQPILSAEHPNRSIPKQRPTSLSSTPTSSLSSQRPAAGRRSGTRRPSAKTPSSRTKPPTAVRRRRTVSKETPDVPPAPSAKESKDKRST